MKLSDIKPNPDNPRIIRDAKFEQLKKSIKEFPAMLELRPMVVDADNVVLGGNMRLRALQDLGYTEIPEAWVKRAEELTEEEKRRFIIVDNLGYGEWDWDELANNWDTDEVREWGLDIPQFEKNIDYGILDDADYSNQLEGMAGGVKKAIQIEFEPEHYDEAFALVKFWRDMKGYIGGMLMEHLKAEKEKL